MRRAVKRGWREIYQHTIFGERAKHARHSQGCTMVQWKKGLYTYMYMWVLLHYVQLMHYVRWVELLSIPLHFLLNFHVMLFFLAVAFIPLLRKVLWSMLKKIIITLCFFIFSFLTTSFKQFYWGCTMHVTF